MLSNDKLRFLRIEAGLSQEDVANWCDVSTRYIKMIEANTYSPTQQLHDAWVNCCLGHGEPLPKAERSESGQKKEKPTIKGNKFAKGRKTTRKKEKTTKEEVESE